MVQITVMSMHVKQTSKQEKIAEKIMDAANNNFILRDSNEISCFVLSLFILTEYPVVITITCYV